MYNYSKIKITIVFIKITNVKINSLNKMKNKNHYIFVNFKNIMLYK